MSEQLLQLLLTYGAAVLLPIIAGAAVGLPLPSSILLLGAGAFAGGGQLGLLPLLLAGIAGAVTGDIVGYWIGRRGGSEALVRWGGRLKIGSATVARAERLFGRWGWFAIFLTRFLLTPLGPVINLVAGTSRYRFRAFVLFDTLGEAIWVVGYVGLGYAFSANWDVLADFLSGATTLLSVAAITVLVLVLLYRALTEH